MPQQPPKPTPTHPAQAYKQRKRGRTISIFEPKIDMNSWYVDPRRIYDDLIRTR